MDWTSFLDVGANLATGGLYGVGKTIYEASDAASKAGNELSKIAAEADQALQQLFKSINAAAFEASETARKVREAFALPRPDGRSQSELSAEEAHRLNALTTACNDLTAKVAADQQMINTIMLDLTLSWQARLVKVQPYIVSAVTSKAKLDYVNKLIGQILYEEPGDVPKITAHIENIVDKFNTIEQQTIEDILNRVNTLEQPRIEGIMDDVTDNLEETQGLVEDIRRLLWIPVTTEKKAFSEQEKVELARQEKIAQAYGTLHALNLSAHSSYLDDRLKTAPQEALAEGKDARPAVVRPDAEPGHLDALPAARSITPSGDDAVMPSLKAQNLLVAQSAFCQREQRKAELAIKGLQTSSSLQPGVLTQTIDGLRMSMARFHEMEQPRIEKLLGSLDQTVQESQKTLHEAELTIAQARTSLGAFQNLIANRWFKIGALVFAGLIGLILLFSVIALGRVAFHI
jgi:hypothetical protein